MKHDKIKKEDLPKRRNLIIRDMILSGKSQQAVPRNKGNKRPKDARKSWKREEW